MQPVVTRRTAMTATAAVPASALPAAAETEDDPAIAAVRRWLDARAAESDHQYEERTGDWEDDPHAEALMAEADRAYWAMATTPPESVAGMAVVLQALVYDTYAGAPGNRFSDVGSWGMGAIWRDGRDVALVEGLWCSPPAADLFAMVDRAAPTTATIEPAPKDDPAAVAYMEFREAERTASAFWRENLAASSIGTSDPEYARLAGEEEAARSRLVHVVATSAAGLAGQARVALEMAECGQSEKCEELEILRSIVAGAERIG